MNEHQRARIGQASVDVFTGNNGNTGGEAAAAEAWGSSQIGAFDYLPPLGFREYWYPGIWARKVGWKKPVHVKLLGDDVVFFRDENAKVVALTEWCPHRSARFSLGICEFRGTVTCPYHGYTFDGTGQCVAGLIDGPESTLVPKLQAQAYPTQEHQGIVYIWMGRTEPASLEEDLPRELLNPENHRFIRVSTWEANWVEPVHQGIDFHESYLHRNARLKFWRRAVNKDLTFFRPKVAYTGGIKIVDEGDNFATAAARDRTWGQGFYPGLNARWPRHVWWRLLPSKGRGIASLLTGKPFDHSVELPSKIRSQVQQGGGSVHLRWMVPVDEQYTRVWTYTIARKPKTVFGQWYQALWYYFWRRPSVIIGTNEKEDLVVFMKDRIRFDLPQKLGPLDTAVIYFRRHLALRARDYQRLGEARGTWKKAPEHVARGASPELVSSDSPIPIG